MRNYHKTLVQLRRESHALAHGGFQVMLAEGDVIAYQRQSPQQQLVIVGYRGEDAIQNVAIPMSIAGIADGTTLRDLLSDATFTVQDGQLTISELTHGQAMVLEVVQS